MVQAASRSDFTVDGDQAPPLLQHGLKVLQVTSVSDYSLSLSGFVSSLGIARAPQLFDAPEGEPM